MAEIPQGVNLEDLGVASQEEFNSLGEDLQKELIDAATTTAAQAQKIAAETEAAAKAAEELAAKEAAAKLQKPDQNSEQLAREKAGILADLHEKREETRRLKEQIAAMEKAQAEEKAKENEKPDDDIALQGDIKLRDEKIRRLEERLASVQDVQKSIEQNALEDAKRAKIAHIAKLEQEVAAEFSADKVGAELEFNNVFDNGFKELCKKNPALMQACLADENPARFAYEHGLTHPTFKGKVAQSAKADGAKHIVEKLSAPRAVTAGNLTSTGSGSDGINVETATVEELAKLSDAELDKLLKG